MPNLRNESFEDAGASAGEAQHWTSSTPASAGEDIAEFTGGLPMDSFETGWSNNQNAQSVFAITDLLWALFESGSATYDNFEASWGAPAIIYPPYNHQSLWAYEPTVFTLAIFSFAYGSENFEEDWSSNQDYVLVYDPGNFTAALFLPGPAVYDNFESHWRSNQLAQVAFGPGDITDAMFDVGANSYDSFEGVWDPL